MARSRRTARSVPISADDDEILNDLDSAAQGGWITVIERLVRWLKRHDCNEYAQPLSRQARPFHSLPTDPNREYKALADISLSLDRLRFDPPSDLDAKARKWLAGLVKNAAEIVEHRMKQMQTEIERVRTARGNAQQWANDNDLSEVENDREGNWLEALHRLKAFDPEHRARLSEVVKKAEGPAADSDNFKQLAANLVRKRLIRSKVGRGGGYWLTERGKSYVEQKRKV